MENINYDGHDPDSREYNIFRWFRSAWGRYTQADPIGIGGRDIESLDRRLEFLVAAIREHSCSRYERRHS